MSGGDLYDLASERATEGESARVLNRAGAVIAWADAEEWDDIAPLIENSDRVELYDESGRWVETLRGDEFKELALGRLLVEI